jgi:hypothetical protein
MNKRALSENELQARRENGLKSKGPSSERGKAASSRNAVRHGILCETVVLEGESTDRFIEHLVALQEYYEPATPIESALVETLAVCRWRQMRIWGLEKAGLTYEIQKQSVDSNDDPATLAYRAMCHESRPFEALSRYETRFDRQYNRTIKRLDDLRQKSVFCQTNRGTH